MRMNKGKTFLALAVLVAMFVAWTTPASGAEIVGRLIFMQGQVAVRLAGTDAWQKARLNQDLISGDMVRSGPNSRAAILCLDESQIKLNENTVLVLKSVAPSPRLRLGEIAPAAQAAGEPASLYGVTQGEIWLRNKQEKFLFELETPTVTATIRGTELNIKVGPDGTTSIILLEGMVKLRNPHGEMMLAAGEEGLARPGRAPTKRVLVQPADAVQWSLFYPGYFSYRDLPLQALEAAGPPRSGPSGRAAELSQGVAAYDQGRLDEAEALAGQALARDPADPRALTLAGWVSLQRRRPEEALGLFQRVPKPGAAALVGTALARYQTGDAVGAYQLMQAAYKPNPGHPLMAAMTGYFAMLLGRGEEARSLFNAALAGPSPEAQLLGRCYLAQMDIVQNRKDLAKSQADQALALRPSSPLALLTRALVDMADFQLPAAQGRLEKALDADPRLVEASMYLAQIYLGGENFIKARRTVDQALRQAPRDARVLALAGFVKIAFRRFEQAEAFFTRSIEASPRLGESHLGLSIVHFSSRRFDKALMEMLTATLLDPQVSLFQSEMGKAFYQVRAFDKALSTWDNAAALDPRDPTPHLYKGIALTDLNRPGEAVQSINRSIALNDNRAIFRSRLGLDRDLSVRNFNLARAYSQLGLGEWAQSKAITAVKYDPYNSSAHLFLANAYLAGSQRVIAYNTEDLLFRVLSPATQTTFRYVLENDYTSMFEMPYARATIQAGVGAWEERKTIQEHGAAAYGGIPGVAFLGEGSYENDRGFLRENGFGETWDATGIYKWEPTIFGNLTGFFQYQNIHLGDGDPFVNKDYFYLNEPSLRQNFRHRAYEVSYLHRFTPRWALLGFFSYQSQDDHLYQTPLTRLDDVSFRTIYQDAFNRENHNFQLQQYLVMGKHTLIGGFDYFHGHLQVNVHIQDFLMNGEVIPLGEAYEYARTPEKAYSFYLLDNWRLTPWLLVELGVFRDITKNTRGLYPRVSNSLWSPRVGLNIQINPKHTIRLALLRHLNTHQVLSPMLVPTEVAGLTWPLDTVQGTEVRAAGASWEAQWNAKTFTSLRLDAVRVATPFYLAGLGPESDPYTYLAWVGWQRYQVSLFLNRILTNSLGLSLGVTGKRILPDETFYKDPLNSAPLGSLQPFTEVNGLLGLSFLTRKGWLGGIRTRLVYQNLRDRSSDNLFALVNLRFGKELANKRGLVTFEVQNLFNRHFGYILEPALYNFIPDLYPARRIIGKVQIWF